ncbi:uncharacterized protein LOC105164996 isoform X2 [Sesamum indicum]|nr:uncharacterized protein LOC105164996 isoform X2 [Sesamum indicum]XP_020550551.1 uncharacterized protein LOC105164996 isoform X2 [Sesamum indicum]
MLWYQLTGVDDLMALLLELLSLVVGLMVRPFSLVRLSFQIGVQSICFVVQTWIEMLRTVVYLHLVIFWRLTILAMALLSLPVRAFAALYRERMLEMQIRRMKTELENAFWDRKELKERLQIAIRECKMMEVMLKELEGEHDEAIVKIELLLEEVQDLKDEIRRLKEIQGKAFWEKRGQADTGNGSSIKNSDHFRTSLCRSGHHDKGTEDATHDLLKPGSEPHRPSRPNTDFINSNNLVKHDILSKQREVALSRSLFSAVLSLIVGIIVWEAEDPCIPLVVALFTVVSMSLISVVRFFSTIKHKPASDAVALLSFNWFILGTLAYPTLPRVARLLAPFVSSMLERTFKGWLFSSSSM